MTSNMTLLQEGGSSWMTDLRSATHFAIANFRLHYISMEDHFFLINYSSTVVNYFQQGNVVHLS